MKKVFGILMIIGSSFLLFIFTLVLLTNFSNMDDYAWKIMSGIFLLPGALLLFLGIRLLLNATKPIISQTAQSVPRQYSQPATAPSPKPTGAGVANHFTQHQVKSTSTSTAEAAAASAPVSVDCPGCGAKTTVSPTQSTNCEYCGTVVQYKKA